MPGEVALRRIRVNGIAPGQSVAQVRAVLGAPNSVSPLGTAEELQDSLTTWSYSGLSVYLLHGQVHGLDCHGLQCATPDGVRIGDSLSNVQRLYGPGVQQLVPGRSYPRLIYSARGAACDLAFDFEFAVVSRMSLECD